VCAKSSEAGRRRCVWVYYIVNLQQKDVTHFKNYLASYVHSVNNDASNEVPFRLWSLRSWLKYMRVVPSFAFTIALVGTAFMLACLINCIAVLLALFATKINSVNIRRALGASRRDICFQEITHAFLLGLCAAVFTSIFYSVGMLAVRTILPDKFGQ